VVVGTGTLASNSGIFSLSWSFNRERGNLEFISIYPINEFSVGGHSDGKYTCLFLADPDFGTQ
jgi:hypothetical protein